MNEVQGSGLYVLWDRGDRASPRTPVPSEHVRDDGDDAEADKARYKNAVKFLSLAFGQPGERDIPFFLSQMLDLR